MDYKKKNKEISVFILSFSSEKKHQWIIRKKRIFTSPLEKNYKWNGLVPACYPEAKKKIATRKKLTRRELAFSSF